jgi:hypothetical protein
MHSRFEFIFCMIWYFKSISKFATICKLHIAEKSRVGYIFFWIRGFITSKPWTIGTCLLNKSFRAMWGLQLWYQPFRLVIYKNLEFFMVKHCCFDVDKTWLDQLPWLFPCGSSGSRRHAAMWSCRGTRASPVARSLPTCPNSARLLPRSKSFSTNIYFLFSSLFFWKKTKNHCPIIFYPTLSSSNN